MDCSGFKFATKVAREAALGDGHVPAGAAVLVHQILNGAPYKGTSLGTPVFVRNIFVGFVTIQRAMPVGPHPSYQSIFEHDYLLSHGPSYWTLKTVSLTHSLGLCNIYSSWCTCMHLPERPVHLKNLRRSVCPLILSAGNLIYMVSISRPIEVGPVL
jgi:hypothetical protein